MAGTCELGLLLALLLPVVSASLPGTMVRLNKAALNYVSEIGKAPLGRALQVTVPNFLDRSGEAHQSTRIQILDVHVPRLHLKFIAGFGIHMSATANFTVQVFCVPKPLEMVLPVVLLADARVAQASIGTPEVSISTCFSLFSPVTVLDVSNSTSPSLLLLVRKHIQAVLSNKLCLRISSLVQGLNIHLGTLIGVGFASDSGVHISSNRGLNPVGPESQIRYSVTHLPTITSDYISLDVSAVLFLLNKPILLPGDATPFLLPWPVGTGAMATVVLSQHMFDSVFLLLQKAGSLNMDITGQLNSEDNLLTTSALGWLIPEVASQFPEPMPVVLKVQLGATPAASLHTNNATLQLQPFVDVLAVSSNSAFQTLFSMDVLVNLSLQLFVSKTKLRGTTSVLGDVQISVAASNVGSIDMDQVHILMGSVFEKPLLDHLNALLDMGIALPSVVNLRYINPEVSICEGYVVISSGLSYQH